MNLVAEVRRRIRYLIGPAVGLIAVCYFVYHVVHGDRGLLAWHHLAGELAQAQEQLTNVRAQGQALEHRVRLLHPESLDLDMLDEVVRRNLAYGLPDETIVQ